MYNLDVKKRAGTLNSIVGVGLRELFATNNVIWLIGYKYISYTRSRILAIRRTGRKGHARQGYLDLLLYKGMCERVIHRDPFGCIEHQSAFQQVLQLADLATLFGW